MNVKSDDIKKVSPQKQNEIDHTANARFADSRIMRPLSIWPGFGFPKRTDSSSVFMSFHQDENPIWSPKQKIRNQ
jgi:hypothetical protein